MKIVHNLTLSVSERERKAFSSVGVELQLGFTTFQVNEEDPRWANISLLAKEFRAVDMAATKFSASELNSAEYVGLAPSWHYGYPEPSDDRGYLQTTFDLKNYCETCGAGMRQANPFRMRKAPIWGNKSVLQLNWVFDEYFVKPDIWARVFQPFGIKYRPVLLNNTGMVIDSVVQLDIPSAVELQLDDFDGDECPNCGRKKYAPVTRGFFPKPIHPDKAMFKSKQYFGSGASANKLVIVSSDLFEQIKGAGISGVNFKPCTA